MPENAGKRFHGKGLNKTRHEHSQRSGTPESTNDTAKTFIKNAAAVSIGCVERPPREPEPAYQSRPESNIFPLAHHLPAARMLTTVRHGVPNRRYSRSQGKSCPGNSGPHFPPPSFPKRKNKKRGRKHSAF